MGTCDVTLYTATCDVGDCESMHGEEGDFGWDWYEFSSECEDAAIRSGWTKVDGLLICKADDDEHQAARGIEPDARPKPGAGQLALELASA